MKVKNLYSFLQVSLTALIEAQPALNSLPTLSVSALPLHIFSVSGSSRSLDTRGRILRNSNWLWLLVVRVSRSGGWWWKSLTSRTAGLHQPLSRAASSLVSVFLHLRLCVPLQLPACVSNHVDDWPVRGLTAPLSWKMNGFSCTVFASDSKALWVVQHPQQNATACWNPAMYVVCERLDK